MPRRILGIEWENQHIGTRYPFEDSATLLSREGVFISDDLFIDAILHIPGAAHGLYLSSAERVADSVLLRIGDSFEETVATAEIVESSTNPVIQVLDLQQRNAGVLLTTEESLPLFQTWPDFVSFAPAATSFVSRVCSPVPNVGVHGFKVGDAAVGGKVWLIGEGGVVLSVDNLETLPDEFDVDGKTYSLLRVDVVGDPLFRRRLCGNERFVTPSLLRTITFRQGPNEVVCVPDEYGQIHVLVGDRLSPSPVLRIQGDGSKLSVSVAGEGTG